MKNIKIGIIGLSLVLGIISPNFIFAATEAGLKPGSFFYIFDTASEKVALFFTFNPEKKAKKALEYADERLAEIEAVAETNPDAVEGVLVNYESNVALATKKSKEVKGEEQEENLLNLITDNASKNQEVLSAVLIKVPEEAKAAITQAIEASKRGQEEARKQITELKQEVATLKQEVAELKEGNNKNRFDIDEFVNQAEIRKLKKEVNELKNRQSSSVPTQAPIIPAKQVVGQNPENKGRNFLESKIDTYKSMIESMKKSIEGMRNNEDISYFKDRRANLVYRLNYAKQLTLMPNESQINGMISLYWQAFEKDIRDVDYVFNVIESNIALTARYQEEYEKGLSSLLANPAQFVTQEELVKFLESEHSTKFVNRVFEGSENVSKTMQNYLATVGGKEDQYAMLKTAITNMLSNSINQLNAITNYGQPTNTYSNSNYEQARVDQIVREIQENVRALDKTTCTFNSGPSGGFEYSTMTCNRSSF